MLDIMFIIVTSFAVLGAYFLVEVGVEVCTTKKCKQVVMLFADDNMLLGEVANERSVVRHSLPHADVFVYSKSLSSEECTRHGIKVVENFDFLFNMVNNIQI